MYNEYQSLTGSTHIGMSRVSGWASESVGSVINSLDNLSFEEKSTIVYTLTTAGFNTSNTIELIASPDRRKALNIFYAVLNGIFMVTTSVQCCAFYLDTTFQKRIEQVSALIYVICYGMMAIAELTTPWSRWLRFGLYLYIAGYVCCLVSAIANVLLFNTIGLLLFVVGSVPFTFPFEFGNVSNIGGLSFLIGSIALLLDSDQQMGMAIFMMGRVCFFDAAMLVQKADLNDE